jgi:hypothetical protein
MKSSKPFISAFFVCILFVINSCNENAKDSDSGPDFQHVIVYHEEGRFAGWPANNGVWKFDNDEILVGFTEAAYNLDDGHNAIPPYNSWLAKSKDGGETWQTMDPENYVGDFGDEPEIKPLEKPINFAHNGFAMRVVGDAYHGAEDPRSHFFFSYDKGVSWNGPFSFGNLLEFPEVKKYNLRKDLTPRTDYLVMGESSCIVFISARAKANFGRDRVFCIQTTDGGQSFQFLGWVIPPFNEDEIEQTFKVELTDNQEDNPYETECRAVMPNSVLLENGTIVTVMRRKYEMEDRNYNWIDAYASYDGGKNWQFLSKVNDAGLGNGNPPAIAVTEQGNLVVANGERTNGTIQLMVSKDQGKTWEGPTVLMDAFWSEDMELNDLGYPRLARRSDGKMVAIYYYSTREHLHHLRATIFDPANL